MFKKIVCAAVSFVFVIALCSCGSSLSDSEVRDIAEDLIERSREINDIFFGDGLPIDEDLKDIYLESTASSQDDLDVKAVSYVPVSADSGYTDCNMIKEAAYSVYTAAYCDESLFPVAFSGILNGDGEVFEYARFVDDEYGLLVQRYDEEPSTSILDRTYDFNSIKIVKQGKDYVIFTIDSYVDGEKSDILRLTIKNGESGWRLDTPTY